MREDIATAPLGIGRNGQPVYLRDIWPSNKEIADILALLNCRASSSSSATARCSRGRRNGRRSDVDSDAATYKWNDSSTYVKNPPYFEGITMEPAAVGDITGARILAELGDSITTDHISARRQYPQDLARPASISASARSSPRTSTATARAAATTRS